MATAIGQPRRFAAFCGHLRVGWHFCEPADPQAKGVVECLQGYAETNFEPGRVFANELHFQDQLDAWFVKVNARTHKENRTLLRHVRHRMASRRPSRLA
jgi:transposase